MNPSPALYCAWYPHSRSHCSLLLVLTHVHRVAGGTRTCIHTPIEPLLPQEMTQERIAEALQEATLVYFDGCLTEAALVVARAAKAKGIKVFSLPVILELFLEVSCALFLSFKRAGCFSVLSSLCSVNEQQFWANSMSLSSAARQNLLQLDKSSGNCCCMLLLNLFQGPARPSALRSHLLCPHGSVMFTVGKQLSRCLQSLQLLREHSES